MFWLCTDYRYSRFKIPVDYGLNLFDAWNNRYSRFKIPIDYGLNLSNAWNIDHKPYWVMYVWIWNINNVYKYIINLNSLKIYAIWLKKQIKVWAAEYLVFLLVIDTNTCKQPGIDLNRLWKDLKCHFWFIHKQHRYLTDYTVFTYPIAVHYLMLSRWN